MEPTGTSRSCPSLVLAHEGAKPLRLALVATIAFLGINGQRLELTNDQAYDLVTTIATGELDDVAGVAKVVRTNTAPRRS
jgi:prophage maintenance system killer protein